MKNILVILLMVFLLFSCDESTNRRSGVQVGDVKEIAKLDKLLKKIDPSYIESTRKANISLTSTNLLELLPDINEYPIALDVRDSSSVEVAQIFTSSEKAGQGTDGLYVKMAEAFNKKGYEISNGKVAKIGIRKIASGAGASFILAESNTPDAYSPSNALWGKMINAQGGNLTTIAEITAENTAGIIVKSSKVELITTGGKLDIQKLLTEVTSGNFAMGYTNPFQSSTGLNFLLTILDAFAEGDEANMLNPEVASAFEAFQMGVPFVAQNTIQMRDATLNSGVLDAFVLEHQTFVKAKGLGGYEFIPFGVKHNSPLYATEEADASEVEVLKLFAKFIESNKAETSKFGFGQGPSHKDTYTINDGVVISQAQKIWKDKKSGGRPIAAVFVADVSGSMDGQNIDALKEALDSASSFISTNNSIGLVTYSDKVNVELPIRKFNLQHKAQFIGAVEDLNAGGGTATNDAILVALDELRTFGESNPDHRLMCFILSDGKTTAGYDISKVKNVIKAIGIPVHAIAYGLDLNELKDIASLVEASYTESSTDSASYNIGNLLNAQM